MSVASSPFDLRDRVAVVTGAARGLGRSAALALGRAGARVVLFDRLESELAATEAELTDAGVAARAVPGDVTRSEDIEHLVGVAGEVGRVDIVVNCAGVIRRVDIADFGLSDLDAQWAVNVRGTVAVTQAFLAQLRDHGRSDRGKVINVGSLGSVVGLERRTGYAATKGAVAQYTVSLASEVGADQVCVNAIAPGYVETAMTSDWLDDADRRRRLLDRIPLGRFATPRDLEGVFVFLASAASDYVTGQVLLVDGGWTTT